MTCPSRVCLLATCAAAAAAFVACSTSPPATPAPRQTDPSTEIRYLALGDSFTAGTGASPEEAFPARLVARWTSSGGCATAPRLRDLGVNGYTTDDLIDVELPQLPAFAPQIVTLAIGANDIVQGSSAATYRAHVRRILAALVAAGVKRIIAIPQPDWSKSPAASAFGPPGAIHDRIVAWNGILETETSAVSGQYVDRFPLMEQQAEAHMLANDGLHPSAAAYDAWAAALATQVTAPCGAGSR